MKRRTRKIIFRLSVCLVIVFCAIYSKDYVFQKVSEFTAEQGFVVNQVYLDGRKYADIALVRKAVDIEKGIPIFDVKIDEITKELEQIPWIKKAVVEIKIPNEIYVTITERQPIALWKNNNKTLLIDKEGQIMPNHPDFANLPKLIGKNVPSKIENLLALVEKNEVVSSSISTATIIRDRRWDVKLQNGVLIKLPEENPERALLNLTKLKNKISMDELRSIDMRIEGRVYIKYKNNINNLSYNL